MQLPQPRVVEGLTLTRLNSHAALGMLGHLSRTAGLLARDQTHALASVTDANTEGPWLSANGFGLEARPMRGSPTYAFNVSISAMMFSGRASPGMECAGAQM